jgi:hypothetical protein
MGTPQTDLLRPDEITTRPNPGIDFGRLARIVAAVIGAVVGAGLLGGIGARSGNEWVGAFAGSILGTVFGYNSESGRIHKETFWVVIFGMFGVLIGPACDDYGGITGIPFAIIGLVFGRFWPKRGHPRRLDGEC